MTIRRLFVEKRPGFDVAAKHLLHEVHEVLGLEAVEGIRIFQRYDVEAMPENLYQMARESIFSEPNQDKIYAEHLPEMQAALLAVELLPGQYDQRADSASQCLQLLSQGQRPQVACAKVYAFFGTLAGTDRAKLAQHLINPVEAREAALEKPVTLDLATQPPQDVPIVEGFLQKSKPALDEMVRELGMAMTPEDLLFCQSYFREEGRDPSLTELRCIDTYWSDHCRHTTFLTAIDDIDIEPGLYAAPIERALRDYYVVHDGYYGKEERDVTLMDMATLGMKALKKAGKLPALDASEEINACSIVVQAEIDGQPEEWLVMFKNETHNHPTEIEGFGGAATCLGGAIRDPLSGRSYVYQAMRISGSGDPRTPLSETRPGKLPQRRITRTAFEGFSSYGNQIGLAAGKVQEVYHPGFVAKRMELGAVIGATPQSHVRRERPTPGDQIVLLGGRTGRDGCGGATGSSKAHDSASLSTCGAEVQKGNPPTERCLQRLFQKEAFSRLVKRCNDFGAGGVCVAVGELAPGLIINLDAVPKKYDGLDGTELAISESQERMACVVSPQDVHALKALADAENVEATVVAEVTESPRLVMRWRDQVIVDLARSFLDTNGVTQHSRAAVAAPDEMLPYPLLPPQGFDRQKSTKENWLHLLSDLNVCSQRGLIEGFDGSIGAATVLAPYGGKHRGTPGQAMAALLPTDGETTTATLMAHGYDPYLSSWSPFHGATYAVAEALAKIVAAGGNPLDCYMTYQEYFERLGQTPLAWGKPVAAMLGGLSAQLQLGIASIGGKDSMSGSFEELTVPPTLVAFAVCPVDARQVLSGDLKGAGHALYCCDLPRTESLTPDFQALLAQWAAVRQAISEGKILSAYVAGQGGIAAAISQMAFGNRVGVRLDDALTQDDLFLPAWGSLVLEAAEGAELPFARRIGETLAEPVLYASVMVLPLAEAEEGWAQPLSSVFPAVELNEAREAPYAPYTERTTHPKANIAKPRALVLSFPGTNCEVDSARAFQQAGAEAEVIVFRNLSPQAVEESIAAIAKSLTQSQILMLPGGFSAGDEPDGSGKFIATTLRNPRIADALMELVTQRDGLVLGICNGFQALLKTGLLPYGEIRVLRENDPTLTYNSIGRHMACHISTVVSSVLSPWMAGCEVGQVHEIPISHGEGRFVCGSAQLLSLQRAGQIVTQYAGEYGKPALQMPHNPNASVWAVEGLCSPDGRIFGKMGHSERIGAHVAKNIPGEKDQRLFASGVAYFR